MWRFFSSIIFSFYPSFLYNEYLKFDHSYTNFPYGFGFSCWIYFLLLINSSRSHISLYVTFKTYIVLEVASIISCCAIQGTCSFGLNIRQFRYWIKSSLFVCIIFLLWIVVIKIPTNKIKLFINWKENHSVTG